MTTDATNNPWAHQTAEAVTNEPAWRYKQIEENRKAWGRVVALVGSYGKVAFGEHASQECFIHKVTKAGKVQVTAFNASRGKWYPNKRTVEPRDILTEHRREYTAFGIPPLAGV